MADNIQVTAGAGSTVAADDVGGVLHQRVKIEHGADGSATDVSSASPLPATLTNVEKIDDAAFTAGTSRVLPSGDMYQASVDEVDANDIGVARMTIRRARIIAPDSRGIAANGTTVANAGDMEVSTTSWSAGYAAPTTAFFNGADAGFDANPRYVRIPMTQYREVAINLYQNLGVNLTLDIYAWTSGISISGEGGGSTTIRLASLTMVTNNWAMVSPYAGGANVGANFAAVPALASPMAYLILAFTPAGDPAAGALNVSVGRRSQ